MSLFNELKRRNVLRVGAAYIVAAWLVIQVAETIFPLFGFDDTPARLVVIVLSIAFIPSLIFAWVFEITPEGLKRDEDVVREHSIAHVTGKKLDRIILVVLALALGYFAFDKFVLSESREAAIAETAHQAGRNEALVESYGDKSIAVLPFVNMSSDPEQEYFSDGISEELLNVLSKIPELRVISRSSAFSFKGKDFDIPTVATQLNVAYILEGSVRKAGNQIRITAQLIEARSDTHLWSETYDRKLDDIFAVQDEISAAIIGALKERLDLQSGVVPQMIAAANTEAHDAYLRGRYLVVQRTKATIEGAVREFEKAIMLDPDYALAHAELTIATMMLARYLYGDLTRADASARAKPHAERAMALAPNLAEAQAAAGFLVVASGDRRITETMEEGLTYFERAIQINPSYAIIYAWMAQVIDYYSGNYTRMFAMRETALRLDPLSLPIISSYFNSLYRRNRLDEFDRELEKIVSIHPGTYAIWRGYRMAIGGKWAHVVLGYLDALEINPEKGGLRASLARFLADLGLEKEVFAISQDPSPYLLIKLGKPGDAVKTQEARLADDPNNFNARSHLGLILALAGDYARARPILEDVWQRGGERVTMTGIFPTGSAAALIAIRRNAGEESATEELVAAIRDNVGRYHEAGITGATNEFSVNYEAGLAAYLAGEHEKGLALIAQGAEDGYFIPLNEAYLQTLYDDPGFAPIRAAQEARQARERDRFLTIVCTDNPYEAVWQPVKGTCETFAAEGMVIEP